MRTKHIVCLIAAVLILIAVAYTAGYKNGHLQGYHMGRSDALQLAVTYSNSPECVEAVAR